MSTDDRTSDSELVQRVETFRDAYQEHDVDRMVEMFADDGGRLLARLFRNGDPTGTRTRKPAQATPPGARGPPGLPRS